MVSYKYLGGWKAAGGFFTKDKVYKLLGETKSGHLELTNDGYEKYGNGLQVSKHRIEMYFKKV